MADLLAGEVGDFARDPQKPNALETHQLVKAFYHERAVREEKRGSTANLFTYREVFEKVGLFRPDFQSAGDADWCHRAVAKGYSLAYAREPRVLHPARFSLRDFVLRYVRTTGGWYQQRLAGSRPPLTMGGLLGYLVPPFGETRRYGSHPALRTLYRKLQFFAVDYLVQGIRIIETVRVLLGGRPIRY